MCGSNSTESAAIKKGIKSHTYDLNLNFDLINDAIKEHNELIFFHSPYWNIIKYSGKGNMYGDEPHPSDISHIADYNEFMRIYNELLIKQYASLKTGGRMAILMGDIKKKGILYSPILDMVKPGEIENIVIKEQFNCWSDRQSYSGKFIPIIHEYLLILRRDNPYIEKLKITVNKSFDVRDSKIATWKQIIVSVFEAEKTSLTYNDIYYIVKGHKKAKRNNHVREKIRQILTQDEKTFLRLSEGRYKLREGI